MVLALSGVALVSWQRCAEGYSRRIGWLLALALSMAGLVSTHYYAALMTVPLFCGELVRLYMRKRFDWAVAACLAAGVSFILPRLPLLRSVRANVAENAATTNYFAAPDIGTLYNAYGALLSPLVVPGVVCLALVVALAGISGKNEGPEARRGVPAHEAAAALALAFFPLIAFLTAVLVTKTFVLRYVLEGAMGLSIVLGFLFHYSLARRPTLGVCILALLYSYFNYMALSAIPVSGRPYGADLSFLEERAGNSPVVVAEGLIFAPMWYYAPAGLQQRLFYVTDLDYARRTTDTTNENIMLKLKPMAPRSIVPLQQFVAAHNSFFVYYRGGSANSSVDELLSRKCGVALEAKRGIQLLFRCNCR
jgi:hypothetical protein